MSVCVRVCVCYTNVKRFHCLSYNAAHATRLVLSRLPCRSRTLRLLLLLSLSLPLLLLLHLLLEHLHEAAVISEGVGRFGRPVGRAAAAGLPAAAAGGLMMMMMLVVMKMSAMMFV